MKRVFMVLMALAMVFASSNAMAALDLGNLYIGGFTPQQQEIVYSFGDMNNLTDQTIDLGYGQYFIAFAMQDGTYYDGDTIMIASDSADPWPTITDQSNYENMSYPYGYDTAGVQITANDPNSWANNAGPVLGVYGAGLGEDGSVLYLHKYTITDPYGLNGDADLWAYDGLAGTITISGTTATLSTGGAAVPVPAAAWLLGSGLVGLLGLRKRLG